MADILRFADKLGPAKIIQVYEPTIDLKAVLVIDNIAMGPAVGGIRMAVDVSIDECIRLARSMTLKNAAAGLSHGGGKTVVYADPKMPKPKKERLIRALACALRNFPEYVMGPDMGTDEQCMAWIKDEINRNVTGLPAESGGIPIDQIGATAWGIRHAIEVAMPYCNCPVGFSLAKARVAIQGFGAVGMNAARFLAEQNAILVGAADSQGSIYDADGLDVNKLIRLKEAGKSVVDYPDAEKSDRDAIVGFDCDIWIPAARPDVINENNMERLKAKLVVEGANIPLTVGAENYLHEKGILVVPDFIANSGGVICAAMEYRGKIESEAMEVIEKKVRTNTRLVLEESRIKKITPREAAMHLAVTRVQKAMSYKRWSIY
ncbi:MAG: Glu/Leu/Phe/Val dehydrogenase [Syntrophobacterales bacterium]|jgi:glutamate dehydrogenase (NAD(P)+)|nr:Glu/Leu/Phe/Val dehydrogenase [Syntrophobacterales bacterium]